jgi:hypothetical protein
MSSRSITVLAAACVLVLALILAATRLLSRGVGQDGEGRPSTGTPTHHRDRQGGAEAVPYRTAFSPDVRKLPVLPPAPALETANPALIRFVTRGSPDEHGHRHDAGERLSVDFIALVPRVDTASEIAAVRFVAEDWSDDPAIRNEAFNLLRRSEVGDLERMLASLLDREGESERMRTFFTQHLGISLTDSRSADQRERASSRLLVALRDRHLPVRREALSALAQVREPAAVAMLALKLDDRRFDGLRDLVIHLLHQSSAKERIGEIRPFCQDSDDVVRIAAIYVLGDWADEASRPEFERAAASPVFAIRRAGEIALGKIDRVR